MRINLHFNLKLYKISSYCKITTEMEQHYCSVSTCFKNNPATPYLTVEACEDHMASQVQTQNTPDASGQLPPVSELRVIF